MALRGSFSIELQKGGGWQRLLTFRQNGALYNMSAYTVGSLIITPQTGTPVELSIANGRIVNGGAAGTLLIRLTKAQIDAINDWKGPGQFTAIFTPTGVHDEAIEFHGSVILYPN